MDWARHRRAQGTFWLHRRPGRWYLVVTAPLVAAALACHVITWAIPKDPPKWATNALVPLSLVLPAVIAVSWMEMYWRAYRDAASSAEASESGGVLPRS